MWPRFSYLVALPVLLAPALVTAHPVTVDGSATEWMSRSPNTANSGLIARDASGHGEYIWSDATADTRTDLMGAGGGAPEVVADMVAFQVTGSPTGIGFLVRRPSGVTPTSMPIQVQIAIDTDRIAGYGQDWLAGNADTKVAEGARWERLVQTLFGSGGAARVLDTSWNKVADAEAVQNAGNVEIFVPWSALGLSGPPAMPLRFTVATFRAQSNDDTVDAPANQPTVSNALDCISDYGDSGGAPYPNTWVEVQDQVVDYHFDLWFDAQGEVYAPLVVQRFIASSTAGTGSDAWYAVRNTTSASLPLDNFKIGDDETPDAAGGEGMFTFPAGATLAAGATYIVAKTGSTYQNYFGKAPDAELPPGSMTAVPDLTPFLPWTGGTAGTMQLATAGDQVLVLDPSNTILDVAVFGNATYPGITSFTPAPGTDQVLTRDATSSDTDDCHADFSNAGQACTADSQCGGICKQCAGNVCGNKPQGADCADANHCDGDEVCDGNGACVTSAAPPCDDNNPCTTDGCTPATGACTHTPVANGTSCSDSDVCNGVETCQAGTCQAGSPLDCSDTDPCTVDSCDKATGCHHDPASDGAPCPDGDACNGDETCQAGVCTAGTPPSCDDSNVCTTDACDPASGCTHTAVSDGTSCADADLCNGAEVCTAGACVAPGPLDCDDGNACTVDSCDATGGCQHANAADGTACTGAGCTGTCTAGSCVCGTGGAGGGSTSSSSSSSSSSGDVGGGSTSSSSGSSGGVQEGSCGCRTVGGDEGSRAAWLLGLAAAALMRRRRR